MADKEISGIASTDELAQFFNDGLHLDCVETTPVSTEEETTNETNGN